MQIPPGVNAGHVEIVATTIACVGLSWWRLNSKLTKVLRRFHIEHEILIDYYCEQTGKRREDLPTRHPGMNEGAD